MGRHWAELRVGAALSRHNSEQDREDDALWAELARKVKEIVDDPRFEPIGAWIIDQTD